MIGKPAAAKVTVWMLLVAGCGGGSPSPPAPAPSRTTEARLEPAKAAGLAPEKTATENAKEAPPTVRLFDPGALPRQKLRYRFAVGPSQWGQLDMKMAMAVGMGGAEGEAVQLPTVRTLMRFDPKSVNADGDLRYEFESTKVTLLKDVPAKADLRERLEQSLSKIAGLKGYAIVSSRGITQEAEIVVPPDAPDSVQEMVDNLRRSVRQLCAPLPEEEVGKGAKWEVEIDVVTPALRLKQLSTHVLREVAAGRAGTDISLLQVAPRQVMQLKKVPGATVELLSMQSQGEGKADWVLDKLVPRSAVNLQTTMNLQATAQDGVAKMTMKMALDLRMNPTKGTGGPPAAADL